MGFVQQWFNEKLQTKEADVIVDDTLAYLRQRKGLLEPYFPFKEYDSRDFLAYITDKVITLASVVSYGAEIPRTNTGKLEKLTSELVKIALSYGYDEETQWRILEAMQNADTKGVYVQDVVMEDGTVLKGENNSLADYLFGRVEDLSQSIIDTLNVMAWQCVQYGKIEHTDYRTNTVTTIDWKDPNSNYVHFPTALTATGDNADKSLNAWDDLEYADGIQTLFNAVDNFIDTNGYQPHCTVMSRKARNKLLEQKSTKEAARQRVAGQNLSAVSMEMLNDLLEVRDIPPIKTFDEQYQIEKNDGTISRGRFHAENRFSFLCENMGQRAMGVTLESKQNLNDTPQKGIYVRTYEKQKQPILDVTEAIATALPVVVNPKKLYSQQVYTA